MTVSEPMQPKQQLLSYLLGFTTLSLGVVVNTSQSVIAQIIPDITLGLESSTTNHSAVKGIINGGAARGSNLFHSFQEFNIDAGKSVYFANPIGIKNILTRVTGSNISNILGTLGVEGTANLFLINPNGIYFGNGASLDIRGSFTATTADSIKLGKNGLFSATAPATSNLLNIQPGALFINALRNQQAEIRNEGKLQISKNLTFDADKINISSNLQAGGNLNLKANNTISIHGSNINTDNYGTDQGGDINITTGSLYLTNASFLSASTFSQGDAGTVKITANDAVKFDDQSKAFSQVQAGGKGNAGGVEIYTKSLEMLSGSELNTGTRGQGDAGTVKIIATDFVKFDDHSKALSQVETEAIGNAGGVEISTQSLELLGGSVLNASTNGQGDAGSVKITATDFVKFDGESKAFSAVQARGKGNAEDVKIYTKSLEMLSGSELNTGTRGQGDAGTVKIIATDFVKFDDHSKALSQVETGAIGNAGGVEIYTKSLELLGGSVLNASTNGQGDAGSVKITATDTVKFDGESRAFSEVQAGGKGNAGDVEISTKFLEMLGGAIISTSTFGQGDAGSIKITATDAVKFDGQSKAVSEVQTGALGNAGDVEIYTQSLELLSGSVLNASTFGQGNAGHINVISNTFTANNGGKLLTTTSGSARAGNITIKVKDNIILDGTETGLFANTEKGSTGKSGNINIDPQIFIIRNGAGIGVNSQGTGKGGNISIEAGTLKLDNQAFINAETASSQGGEITLNIQDLLLLRHNSRITATAGTDKAGGDGGNININTPFIVAVTYENNDITANAFEGKGGNINITTNALFGIEFHPQLTPKSDITASSEFGVSGNVEITTPGVDPISGLTNLPTSLVDVESLNKDVCAFKDGKVAGGSSFIITGKGGLPADTHELISNSPAFVEWENNSETVTQINLSPVKVTQETINHHPQIQQAQGWIITPDGKFILTANTQKVTLQTDKNNLPDCK